mmetsp:Transcript_34312/g.76141  ORF Transcript_34312/g.76141 Transcript_34312/m.76141 type:complete len:315 (-) Transcript_34312:692-1636(-)
MMMSARSASCAGARRLRVVCALRSTFRARSCTCFPRSLTSHSRSLLSCTWACSALNSLSCSSLHTFHTSYSFTRRATGSLYSTWSNASTLSRQALSSSSSEMPFTWSSSLCLARAWVLNHSPSGTSAVLFMSLNTAGVAAATSATTPTSCPPSLKLEADATAGAAPLAPPGLLTVTKEEPEGCDTRENERAADTTSSSSAPPAMAPVPPVALSTSMALSSVPAAAAAVPAVPPAAAGRCARFASALLMRLIREEGCWLSVSLSSSSRTLGANFLSRGRGLALFLCSRGSVMKRSHTSWGGRCCTRWGPAQLKSM